ncbi:CRISPR-associated endonuclease Cas2 [Oceanobacillus sp. J11TS1]|uniref:CRISPR-associated endonuclease Cas2 n=1 Tax=Oceanobacillus sp. J11TS1 TaxID=2807191 RepID=UPI001B0A44C0|nr:CRISPR-associated endonuclease Cas2 [Oceanobacillus sp. J11TS1]GIO23487.1 CRISPR-associated endoribonuclease Cas2 [Oceanobacillus sp. J11TS1]
MLIIVTYDVSTSSIGGQKRLRKVAKTCQNYGQRVQNSVFECIVNSTQYTVLKNEILSIIDTDKDSIRFYRLGDNHHSKVEHFGIKESLDLEGPLIF